MKITYLIRTNSLDADERFVKTLAFLSRLGVETEVFAIVRTPSAETKGYAEQQLTLRRVFPSGGMLALKALEMLLRTALYLLTHRGRRWYANFDFLPLHVLTVAFASEARQPIWDLHEMPAARIIRSRVLSRIIAFLLCRSHVIVCNDARRRALEETFGVDLSGALVLRNTPGRNAFDRLLASRRAHLSKVTPEGDLRNIIITGGNAPGRYVRESVEVIKKLRKETGQDLRVTLVGGAPLDDAREFVTSTGFIPFDALVERCVQGGVSLCFYRMNSLNNTLCEPNRFYQSLVAGQYVLSFNHPSLNDLSYPWHIIVEESDFHASLRQALERVLVGSVDPQNRLAEARHEGMSTLTFENQFPAFKAWFASRLLGSSRSLENFRG